MVVTKDGSAFVSLWNASRIAELENGLSGGRVRRMIELSLPASPIAPGSHPTAMLLSPDHEFACMSRFQTQTRLWSSIAPAARSSDHLSTKLPGQVVGGSAPNALTCSADGSHLFVANGISDSVAVFDLKQTKDAPKSAAGFIPTQVFPTALAIVGNDLFIASAKGVTTGPITTPLKKIDGVPEYPYPGSHDSRFVSASASP